MKKQILSVVSILLFGFSIISAQTPTEKPKTISGGVLNFKAIRLVKPSSYPATAVAVRASGVVNVQVTIDEAGNVISADAVSGHPLLREVSEKAARESKFSPTLLQGQPVKVTGIIIYNFVLSVAWVQMGYELSLAEKSLSLNTSQTSSIAKSFPASWNEEREDLNNLNTYLAEKSAKEKSQSKQPESTGVDTADNATPIQGTSGIRTTILGADATYQLDTYSIEILKKSRSKIENRLNADKNKLWYFKVGESLGKIIAEIDDETKTRANAQELNQHTFGVPSNVSDLFVVNIKNIVEISKQNISNSDKKEKMIAVIRKLQDN